jgi:FMN reductase (NADPH)
MTLGWPAIEPFIRPRLPLEAVLHWERYDLSSEAEALAAYDLAMAETGIYRGRQLPVPDVEGEVADYGWLEHSARRVSQPVRTHLLRVLQKQGFALE